MQDMFVALAKVRGQGQAQRHVGVTQQQRQTCEERLYEAGEEGQPHKHITLMWYANITSVLHVTKDCIADKT